MPDECIRFLYQSLGIDEVFLLCAVGPARHEVMNTIRLFGQQIIPHFR
jgi:hypothetical protein